MKKRLTLLVSIILILTFWGCNSPEFTSLKMYVQENNLEKAEEQGLLALEKEPDNALIPYILAVDVYLKQKQYEKMAEMFEEALRRNPEQKLESPFIVEGEYIGTVEQAISIYRDQEWGEAFNEGVRLYNEQDIDGAIKKFELAVLILPTDGRTYGTLSALYLNRDNVDKARELIKKGLKYAPEDEQVLLAAASLAKQEKDNLKAIDYFKAAIKVSKDPGPIMRNLIFLYIDLEDYEQAIEYSMEAMKEYPFDADIYYNVGVLYQKMALNAFDKARDDFLVQADLEHPEQAKLQEIYDGFYSSLKYSQEAKDYFQQTVDLETEDTGATKAVKEMKKLIEQLRNIFLPAVEELMEK